MNMKMKSVEIDKRLVNILSFVKNVMRVVVVSMIIVVLIGVFVFVLIWVSYGGIMWVWVMCVMYLVWFMVLINKMVVIFIYFKDFEYVSDKLFICYIILIFIM